MFRHGKILNVIFIASFVFIFSNISNTAENACDFIDEAELLNRTLACAPGQLPSNIDKAQVEQYCRDITKHIAIVQDGFVKKAIPFISALLPKGIPNKVVYPFGGGDLLTALVTYPEANEHTTISLESAGDPRRLRKASKQEVASSIKEFREMIVHFLDNHDSKNDLRKFDRGIIPGQLAFSLIAAKVCNYEPVSLKYFKIEPDGRLYYYTKTDIAALEKTIGKKLAKFWIDTDFSVAFRNMELTLRRVGNGPGPEIIVHRHIAANLDNQHFPDSPLKKHLESKGKISAITKAGSYLLWFDDFAAIRNYMLSNMTIMIADSTGILPRHAKAAGFEQITYGKFHGAFLDSNGGDNAVAMSELWKSQQYRPLPFRYGYSDVKAANHLMIMKPKEKK
ncbi:MAG: hypothetical protein V1874_03020 [Spirochaetota bacterium]